MKILIDSGYIHDKMKQKGKLCCTHICSMGAPEFNQPNPPILNAT